MVVHTWREIHQALIASSVEMAVEEVNLQHGQGGLLSRLFLLPLLPLLFRLFLLSLLCVGGVSKTSRSAQAVPDPAQGAGATVPVPALRGQAQAKQPSCISPAQPSANT